MQKVYNIKWREQDIKKLRREVQRFNSKRSRLIKNNPALEEFLPAKLSMKNLRESIETRRDFNNTVNSLGRFMKKDAAEPVITPQGIFTTKYELRELKNRVRAINIRKTYERKKADVSTEKGTMGTIEAMNLLPKQFNPETITPRDWEHFKQSVEKQSKGKYMVNKYAGYKQNYIAGAYAVYGSGADEIAELIEDVPPEIIMRWYYDDPVLSIDFHYDPQEAEFKRQIVIDHIKQKLEEME